MKRTKPDVLVLSIPDDAPLAVPSNILADMETLGVNARVGVILSANHPAVASLRIFAVMPTFGGVGIW